MADDTKRAEGPPPPPPPEDRRAADASSPLLQRLAQLNAARAAPKLPGIPPVHPSAPKPGATPSPDVPAKPPLGMGKAPPTPPATPPPTPTTAAVVVEPAPTTPPPTQPSPPPAPASPPRAISAPELPAVPTRVGPPPAPELPLELIENASVLTVPVTVPRASSPTNLTAPPTRRPNTAPIVSAPGVVATREAAPMRASSEPAIVDEPSTVTDMPGAPTTVGPAPERMDAARLDGSVTNTGVVLVDHDPSLDVLDTGADTLPPDNADPSDMPGVPTTVGPAPLPEDDGELAGEPTRVVVNPQAEPAPEPYTSARPTLLDQPIPAVATQPRKGFVEAKTTFEVDPSAAPATLPGASHGPTAPMAIQPSLQDSGAWPRPDGVISGSLGGDDPPRQYDDTGGREVTPIEVAPPEPMPTSSGNSGSMPAQVSGEVEVPAYKRPPADAPSPAERAAAAAAQESSRRRAAALASSSSGSGSSPSVSTTGAVSFRSGQAVGTAVAMPRAETEPPPRRRATWPLLVLGLLVGLAGGVAAMWFFGDRLRGGDAAHDAATARPVPTTGAMAIPDALPAVAPPVAVVPDAAPPDAPPPGCRLHVTSLPAGAQVVIDGVDAGVTPLLDLKWPCGAITLVARAGRLEATRKLTLDADKDAWVFVGLGRGLAKVDIISNPAGAMVEIGGQPAGMTPLTVELPAGKTTVRASHPGHREATQVLIPRAGRTNRVILNLAPMRRGR